MSQFLYIYRMTAAARQEARITAEAAQQLDIKTTVMPARYTIPDLVAKGYRPSALRYLLLTTHYRKQLNFTFDGLKAAAVAMYPEHRPTRRLR